MRATVFYAKGDVPVENVPDPVIQHPTDAIVRDTHACICGFTGAKTITSPVGAVGFVGVPHHGAGVDISSFVLD